MQIELNAGTLSDKQINELLASLKGEVFFFDRDKRLQYYKQPVDMNYHPQELGKTFEIHNGILNK